MLNGPILVREDPGAERVCSSGRDDTVSVVFSPLDVVRGLSLWHTFIARLLAPHRKCPTLEKVAPVSVSSLILAWLQGCTCAENSVQRHGQFTGLRCGLGPPSLPLYDVSRYEPNLLSRNCCLRGRARVVSGLRASLKFKVFVAVPEEAPTLTRAVAFGSALCVWAALMNKSKSTLGMAPFLADRLYSSLLSPCYPTQTVTAWQPSVSLVPPEQQAKQPAACACVKLSYGKDSRGSLRLLYLAPLALRVCHAREPCRSLCASTNAHSTAVVATSTSPSTRRVHVCVCGLYILAAIYTPSVCHEPRTNAQDKKNILISKSNRRLLFRRFNLGPSMHDTRLSLGRGASCRWRHMCLGHTAIRMSYSNFVRLFIYSRTSQPRI